MLESWGRLDKRCSGRDERNPLRASAGAMNVPRRTPPPDCYTTSYATLMHTGNLSKTIRCLKGL